MTRNTALIEACAGVLGNPQPHLASISIEFVSNTEGASYSFKPFTVQELQFDFNFTGDVFTSILTAIKVSGYDYGLLQDQTQNILATVVITPRNIDGSRVTTVAPYLQQFHVMLVNAADSRITASDLHLHVEPTKDILIRLVDPLAYRLRHEAVNCILRKATVSDMIHYLAHCHDVDNIDVIEPDNTYRWDHLILPSYPNFTAGLGYLQSQYGVYAKGCNYYIHNDRLYVYPPFETSPDSQGTLTFYQSRQGQATMGGSKHSKAGDDYRIIVDQPAATTDLSVAGAENHGTAISFTRAARSQDGMSYNDPHTGVGFTEDNSVIMSAIDPQTLDSTRNKIKQIRSTSNPFPHLSLMAAHRCAMMTAHWDGADINAIVPGKKVIYCYDENGFLSQRNGILERAHFIYRRQQRVGPVDMFSIDADLAIRLEPSPRKTY